MKEFRDLYADEIDVRVGNIVEKSDGTLAGASVLLYKNARCDMDILDETCTPLGWKRQHTRDNHNCIVSVYNEETKEWVSKEDVGTPSNAEAEKGLASDSFKRACTNWGIGRKLYSVPNLFFFANELKGLTKSQNGKKFCNDSFSVTDIKYDDRSVISVTIAVSDRNGNVYFQKTFEKGKKAVATNVASSNTQSSASQAPAKQATVQTQPTQTTPAQSEAIQDTGEITADTVILFGNFRGKKFGDAKNSNEFPAFINWIKTSSPSYAGNVQTQFNILKEMATNGKL